ncbi:MAG TPA: sulfatase-like hydrolase/transferase [Candidatus Latescibacteria bacterium]|nr:sulfatase-like hydrolase/transferase [Candidatus Latescibacterota bacterium]
MPSPIKSPLRAILLFVLSLAAVLPGLGAGAPAGKDMNVLLITIDTLRYDRMGILSDKYVKTPNLDALARRSAVFTHAYAQTPLTRPSHTNIMTGTTPLYHGVSDNPGFKLESRYLTLAEALKSDNYKTGAFIGAFVLDSRFGLDQGFDVYDDDTGGANLDEFDVVERTADQVVAPAMDWIAAQNGKWFCWVHVFDPHDPYTPPEPFRTEYPKDPYSGEVAFVDAQLGRLFDSLEKSGALAKTIVIVTADHGEAFGEKDELRHGFFAYNDTIHIPLILYVPGGAPEMVKENAAHIDIFPTVCNLVGLPVPAFIQGESLMPLIAGKTRQKPLIYFESMSPNFTMDGAPLSGFIEGDLKFIDQPIKEVYDLAADPGEENNLAPTSDVAGLTGELEAFKKGLKGKGTTQDWKGKNPEIRPLLESLGYVGARTVKKKAYGPQDDLKALQPLIAQLRMAIDDYRAGNPEAGVKKLTTILRIRPNYINAYTTLADIYDRTGRLDQAQAVLDDGLDKNPRTQALNARLGALLIKAKKYADAIAPLKEYVDGDPYNPQYFGYLGLAQMATGQLKPAEKNLKKALELEPDLVPALNNLGYLYLSLFVKTAEEKYYEMSTRNFDAALALEPGLPSAVKGKEEAVRQKAIMDAPGKKGF